MSLWFHFTRVKFTQPPTLMTFSHKRRKFMASDHLLSGKKILIVDDEPDILETLTDLLDTCDTETANDFDTAAKLLKKKPYDAAVLDIMGVNGYGLLEIANQNGIPALMLTAHALTSDNLIASIKGGAYAYIPKDKMVEIEGYMTDLLKAHQKGLEGNSAWFDKLLPFFDLKFGDKWKEKDRDFWQEFDKTLVHSRKELEGIL